MTPDQLAARTARARDAAVDAGRALGLTVTDATVLHDVFSVVVHLAPSPVVARVPTVLPPHTDLDAQSARQQTELDVVEWLGDQGTPVIPPSPLVRRSPVQRDGFSMTFWKFVEQGKNGEGQGDEKENGHEGEAAEPDIPHNSALVADLHAAMRAYPGDLPFLSAAEPEFVTESLATLQTRPDLIGPADLARARSEWEILEPFVRSRASFEAAFPHIDCQPIHGDAPAVNIVPTPQGHLYADFELATLGPVEWDLAALGPDSESAYNAAARRQGLRQLDEHVLRFVNAVGMSRTVACLALVPQLPMLKQALEPAIDHWRTTPFAPGLHD